MGLLEGRELLVDGARDDKMQFLAAALEQRLVGRVLDQRVLELVGRVRRDAAHVEQFRVGQLAQRRLQSPLRRSDEPRAAIRRKTRCRSPPPTWVTSLAGPSRSSRAISESCSVAGISRPVSFASPLSSTARVNSSTNSGTPPVRSTTVAMVSSDERLRRRDLRHHRAHVARAQPVERDLRVMRAHRPRRAELGPRRVQQQQPRGRALLDQQLDQLQRRGIDPVQVLDRDHQRLRAGGAEHPFDQRRQQAAALLLGRQRRRRILRRQRQIQQRREQRDRFGRLRGRPAVSRGCQLRELVLGRGRVAEELAAASR